MLPETLKNPGKEIRQNINNSVESQYQRTPTEWKTLPAYPPVGLEQNKLIHIFRVILR